MARISISNLEGTNKDIFSFATDWEKNIGTGLDFTSIRAAVADLDRKTVSYPKLYLEAGTYNEKILDGFEKLLCSTLELVGDTRDIIGTTYVDGYSIQTPDETYGGEGTCAISLAGDAITVTGTTTNPDFAAAGLVAGDKIQLLDNANAIATYEIQSVSGNSLTMTTTPTAVGNDGTSLTIMANRVIEDTSCLLLQENFGNIKPKNIILNGLWLKDGGAGIISAQNMQNIVINNCIFDGQGESNTLISLDNASLTSNIDYSISCINSQNYSVYLQDRSNIKIQGINNLSTVGMYAYGFSNIHANYARNLRGGATNPIVYSRQNSRVLSNYNVTLGYNKGIYIYMQSFAMVVGSTYKSCSIGVNAYYNSYVDATSTGANMSGNTTDYSPAVSDTVGNVGAYITRS